MTACPRCGVENKEGSRFCFNCGAAMASNPQAGSSSRSSPRAPRRVPGPDPLGLAGFALFLVIVGVVFAANPEAFGQLFEWFRRWTAEGAPSRPPNALLSSAILFFGLTGVSSFAIAALRIAISGLWVRAIGDAMSGIAQIAFAYLLTLYERRALGGTGVLAFEAVTVGLLIFVYVAVGLAVGFGRRLPSAEARRPARR